MGREDPGTPSRLGLTREARLDPGGGDMNEVRRLDSGQRRDQPLF